MPLPELESWIRNPNRDYKSGFELYQRYGKSKFLHDLFAQGEDDYNMQRLLLELKSLNAVLVPKKESARIQVKQDPLPQAPSGTFSSLDNYTRFSETKRPPVQTDQLPEQLQKLVVEKSSLYKQCCSMHQRIEYMATDKERAAAAQLICDHFRRIDEIWQQIDYYQQHKIMRPKHGKDLSKLSVPTLIKRRNTVRTYVSRLKGDPTSEAFKSYSAELDALQHMIDMREEEDA